MTWAEKRNIRLEHIQPGKPQQNAYIERFNHTVRPLGRLHCNRLPGNGRMAGPY
jgi:transposase InsO family protein